MSAMTDDERLRLWKLLQRIHTEVNLRVGYTDDVPLYGKVDFWEIADRAGDCEDYALAKRQALIQAGFPLERLSLAICRDETGGGHAVLLAELPDSQGRDVGYCLDNRQDLVVPWRSLPYRWIMRQTPGAADWETLA